MVLPVSDGMRERVTGEAYERKVEEEKERLDLTLQETDNAS